jgi:hypothetical protein
MKAMFNILRRKPLIADSRLRIPKAFLQELPPCMMASESAIGLSNVDSRMMAASFGLKTGSGDPPAPWQASGL